MQTFYGKKVIGFPIGTKEFAAQYFR